MADRQEPGLTDPDLNFQFLGPLLDRVEADPLTLRRRADPLEDHPMESVPQVIQDQPREGEVSGSTPDHHHPRESEGRSCLELLQFGPGSMTASRKRPLEAIAEDLDGWIATEIGECSGWVGLHPQSCSRTTPDLPPLRYVVDQAELREAERRRRNTSGQLMDIEPPTGRKPEAGGHGTTQNPEREEAEEQAGAGTGPARQVMSPRSSPRSSTPWKPGTLGGATASSSTVEDGEKATKKMRETVESDPQVDSILFQEIKVKCSEFFKEFQATTKEEFKKIMQEQYVEGYQVIKKQLKEENDKHNEKWREQIGKCLS